MNKVKVIGGGLAGVEASFQLSKMGFQVDLYEMRPTKNTVAHQTGNLAELICSNSLKSEGASTSSGVLKQEMDVIGSIILDCAREARVPAGGALAVDRLQFSKCIETKLANDKNITIIRQECSQLDNTPTILATGPLTSDTMVKCLQSIIGEEYLSFFDAVAPIITADSIDMNRAFFGARYNKGESDYINCPMEKDEYYEFVNALNTAEVAELKDFEKGDIFESCMPVEVMSKRGVETLRFGPLRPVGIYDPITNKRAYAVVQLRKEDNINELYNIVGFQTNLKFAEQKRVFSMIPALKKAEFVRYGVMHRNTYINSPNLLNSDLSLKANDNIFVAGQLNGGEGYVESAMTGMVAGINLGRKLKGELPLMLPQTTTMGSLISYITTPQKHFAPMHSSFSLLPPLGTEVKDKSLRKEAYGARAIEEIKKYLKQENLC